ncbi:cytochrome c-type biogenesis protein CcmH [Ectothiorhodosinus mongolicus]|uniref:Cytochrome c-type biogenesis protein n=1 Tax=Ectothiorhodosinus mongolicus TaxID=233100 RepID=A0A1R3VYX9_9GAMM|nr:cytochrome c-type biogenesis protein [Ectothiorhodosinus mongolicus]ULX57184.1 cytochrome c-type biogenesis protein CcmH [Ectothiorhodosinus mongolicus]SIT70307.1 cytochrome c-type biogenesis protein CcmH [Ectothiorhodosinus mongolicus]
MPRLIAALAVALAFALATAPASSQQAGVTYFEDPSLEQRYRELLHELRCTVCQNQSLADSDAGLARDLRRELRDQLNAGSSNPQIIDFMVARYGEFVLYRPPFSPATYLLWIGPFVLLVFGLIVLWATARGSQTARQLQPTDEQAREKARRLLSEGKDV